MFENVVGKHFVNAEYADRVKNGNLTDNGCLYCFLYVRKFVYIVYIRKCLSRREDQHKPNLYGPVTKVYPFRHH